MMLLVVVEHDRGVLAPATQEALTGARSIAQRLGVVICALTIGGAADGLAAELDVATVYQAHDDVLGDYGPEAWGETVAAFVRAHNVPYLPAELIVGMKSLRKLRHVWMFRSLRTVRT